jgi:hypothetical protein
MDVLALVPLPVRVSPGLCRLDAEGRVAGRGIAVCRGLGLLVISSCDKLHVFVLPDDIARGGQRGPVRELVHVRTLGPWTFGSVTFFGERRATWPLRMAV